jgi:hypothetical protein
MPKSEVKLTDRPLVKALLLKAQPAKKPGESDIDFLRRIHAVEKGC